jgi:hypothetical protein
MATTPKSYFFPDIGESRYQLVGIAQEIYNFLEMKGIIDRLKNTPQLGVLSNVYSCAHHTRWEYVNLQLYILHIINDTKDNDFITSIEVPLSVEKKHTPLEILQSWILLLNVGHMAGTFSSEMAMMDLCLENKSLRKKVQKGLPSNYILTDYYNRVLDNYKIFKL